jgi:Glycosyl hydrolases family 2, TIM barrel domain/Glycosyl hydrolases family 2, sugar binding domain
VLRRVAAAFVLLSVVASSGAPAQGPFYPASAPTAGALYQDGQTGRYLLGGTWLYRPDMSDVGIKDGWWRDVAATDGWSPVTVPNVYNAGDFSHASMDGWVGWYRRDFTVPTGAFPKYVAAGARHWIIRFESVNYRASVWLNGHLLGRHVVADLPFEFDLKYLRPGVNRLIVRVDNRRGPADMPPGPGGLWWNYGGINREVYLRAASDADLAQVQVRPVLGCPTGCGATIVEQAVVRNVTSVRQTVRLRGVYGSVPLDFGTATIRPHGTWTALATATIAHPRLWAIDRPTLYRATLTLSDSHNRRLGGYVTYSGIRSITLSQGHLELNGRLLHLRGVALHEQTLARGSALQPADTTQLIAWVRGLGANVIRTHYPLNPEIEEMADRYGILIWAEVPVYQLSSANLARPSVIAQAHSLLQQDILTNQNHPSVMLWSIGNELPTPASASEARYVSGAVALAHRLDPTRPVAMAVRSWPGVPCQSAYAPLDVIGYNDYFGWFGSGGTTDDRDALGPYLDSLHACYPNQALMITEFGFDANRDGPVEERGTYAFQANSVAFHLGVFAARPWLSGAIYWTLQDFAAAPGWAGGNPRGTPPFVQKGLVDLQGNLKPGFSVVSGIYHATVQIARRRLAR